MNRFYIVIICSLSLLTGVSCSTPRNFMVQEKIDLEESMQPKVTATVVKPEAETSDEAPVKAPMLVVQSNSVGTPLPEHSPALAQVPVIETDPVPPVELPAEVDEVVALNKLPVQLQTDPEEATTEQLVNNQSQIFVTRTETEED